MYDWRGFMRDRIDDRRRRDEGRRRDRQRGPLRAVRDIPFEIMAADGDLYLVLECGHRLRELDVGLDENHIPIPDELAPGDAYLFRCGGCRAA